MAQTGNNNPIGILDSGVGGLSLWKEVVKQLPGESTIYFADSKNCPYGSKSLGKITRLTSLIVDFLIKKKCKLILIACNTITVSIIDNLRSKYNIPFVAVEPATKVAAQNTKTKNIVILATRGTFKGDLYNSTKKKFTKNIKVYFQSGDGLVEIVESGEISSPKTRELLKKYLTPFLEKNVDQVVLGCTHYPFLIKEIEKITKGKISIIDPAAAVAEQVKRQLKLFKISAAPNQQARHIFYTTGSSFPLKKLFPGQNFANINILKNFCL